jgi:sarcosine oxidase
LEPSARAVRVTTNKGTYEAANLIVTAGSWLPNFLPAPRAAQFTIRRQVQYWFAVRSERDLAQFKPDRFPVYIWLVPAQGIYGFPALGSSDDGVKIATEQDHLSTTPESVDRTVSAQESEEMYETYVRPYFPGLTNRCVRAEVCLYTKTEGSRFIIDRHPSMTNVIVASPCSGHGFKHSAAIGELLAQMALGEPHARTAHFAFDGPA